jgi:hypothetical protein
VASSEFSDYIIGRTHYDIQNPVGFIAKILHEMDSKYSTHARICRAEYNKCKCIQIKLVHSTIVLTYLD